MRQIKWLSLAWLITLLAPSAWALDPIYTPWHNNLAIKGYDPVAYFTMDQPVEGSAEFEYEWRGATWRFANARHQAMFRENPEQYAPQYGGYCAYAVAENKTAGIDPSQFTILDGKLYLNYNHRIQQRWLKQRDEYIRQADEHWQEWDVQP